MNRTEWLAVVAVWFWSAVAILAIAVAKGWI